MHTNTTQERTAIDCGLGSLPSMVKIYTNTYHPYLAIAVCVFGTIANTFNIVVLSRKDMVWVPINRILRALALADMILMIEYIPYAIYHHFVVYKNREFPYVGAVFVLFHGHFAQTLHTTSICLTLTLAIWRYLAIGYPQKNSILCSEWRCTLAIRLSYLLPIMLCAPTYDTITIATEVINEDGQNYTLYHTDLSEGMEKSAVKMKIYFWIYAVFIKLLPCCILTIISCWLIYTLFKAKRRKQVLRDNVPFKDKHSKRKASKAERRADRTTKMLVAVLFLFLVTEFPQGIFAFFIGVKGKQWFSICYQAFGEVMDVLALINGAINFILYCCMNRMFRVTFAHLFCRKKVAKKKYTSQIHTSTVANGTNTTDF